MAAKQIGMNFTSPGAVPNGSNRIQSMLEGLIPGFGKNLGQASNVAADQLSGNVSPSIARNANAYFGVQSGMPGSDFVRNRGFDLYNQQRDQRQNQGFNNVLNLLSGVSGNVVQPQVQSDFANAQLQQQGNQFSENMGLQREQLDLNKLQALMGLVTSNPFGGLGDILGLMRT